MRVDTDLECGNGINIQQLALDHFTVDTVGEGSSYSNYFLIRVTNDSAQGPSRCKLEVRMDPTQTFNEGDRRCFERNAAPPLWVGLDGEKWTTMRDYQRHDMRLTIPLDVEPGHFKLVSPFVTLGCTEMNRRMVELAAKPRTQLHNLGASAEGRSMPMLTIGNPALPRILVISGLHAIEFPGVWASLGIAEHLTSNDPRANELLEHFCVDILPHANPDGTVRGRQRTNVHEIDLHRQANPAQKNAPEIQAIWNHARSHPPTIYINLHGWTACERGTEPFEGSIRPHSKMYREHGLEPVIEECDRRLIAQAKPISRYERIEQFGGGFDAEEQNLVNLFAGAYGTIGYVYEPNMRIGKDGCRERGVQVLHALAGACLDQHPAVARGGKPVPA